MLNIVKIQCSLEKCPAWIFTIIVTLAILYLTLWPNPLPDDTPELFPGADKVVHALMFGGLTLVVLLDRQRLTACRRQSETSLGEASASGRKAWQPLRSSFVWSVAFISAFSGVVIECLQFLMGLGRGFEVGDILADAVGAFTFGGLWLLLQKHWTR